MRSDGVGRGSGTKERYGGVGWLGKVLGGCLKVTAVREKAVLTDSGAWPLVVVAVQFEKG